MNRRSNFDDDRTYGAMIDPITKVYVRWVSKGMDHVPFLAVRDCYQFIGIKRVEIPRGSRVKSIVRGAVVERFWKEYYEESGNEGILGVPEPCIRDLTGPLSVELALKVSGGIERLEYFVKENLPKSLARDWEGVEDAMKPWYLY